MIPALAIVGLGLWTLVVGVPAPQGGFDVWVVDHHLSEEDCDGFAQQYETNGQQVYCVPQDQYDAHGVEGLFE